MAKHRRAPGTGVAPATLEEALARLSELETLYRLTPVGLCVVDRELRFVKANDTYAQMAGQPLEALMGRTLHEIVPESTRAVAIASASEVIRTGQPLLEVEHRRVLPEAPDDVRTLLVNVHPVERDGEVMGAMAVLQDVTSVRRAEEEARERLRELESVYRSAPVGLCFMDPELRYLRVNQSIADMNGVPIEEIVGRRYRDLALRHGGVDPEPFLMDLIARGGSFQNLEVRARPPSDRENEHAYLLSMEPVRDAVGEVVGYSAAVQDVTQLRRAEAMAARRLQELEILYANAPVGLCQLDAELRIANLNARFAQLSGWPLAEQLGEPLDAVLSEPLARQLVPQIAYVRRSGRSLSNLEVRGALPHGGNREFAWIANLHPLAGAGDRVTGVVVVLQDVTVLADRQRETEAVRDRLAEAQQVAQVGSWEWELIEDRVWWSPELYIIVGEPLTYEPSFEGFFEHVHPDDRQTVRTQLDKTLEGGEPYHATFRILRPDGALRWLFTAARLERLPSGLPARLVGTCQDVTEFRMAPPES